MASRAVVLLLALATFAAAPTSDPAPAAAASLSDQIAAARKRQAQLERALDSQQAVLSNLRADEAATERALDETVDKLHEINADQRQVRERIEKAEAALVRVEARHEALLAQLAQVDWTLGLLEQELASGEEELLARRESLGERLADAYRTESTPLLQQVLTAASFTDVVTTTSAYLAYSEQDAELARLIAEDQAALDTLRLLTSSTRMRTDQLRREVVESAIRIEARKAELNEARRELERLERKTERVREKQRERLHELAKNRRQAERIVARQQAAERRLKRHIAGLVLKAQALARRRLGVLPGREGNGIFDWPTTGTVTQEFGCTGFALEPPRGSCPHFHDGIDIANGAGTRIFAAGAGVVAWVGYNPYEGYDPAYLVVIGHPNGLETTYAHLQPRAVVRQGQLVRKGQLIGYMGNTGNSTGNHLHWEVYRGDTPLNPRAFL